MHRGVIVAFASVIVACAQGGSRADDAAVAGDAAPRDAGTRDAAAPSRDAAEPDGAARDAGPGDAGASDAGAVVCTGVASGCATRSAATCTAQLGCTTASGCHGTPAPCSAHGDEFDCLSDPLCQWSGGCVDDGRGCEALVGPTTCDLHDGCVYGAACGGTPTPCANLGAASCVAQDGCTPTP